MDKVKSISSKELQAYWVGVINEARHYPDGVTAYCSAYNISKRNYYSWFTRLRARHANWTVDLPRKKNSKTSGQRVKSVAGSSEVVEKAKRKTFSAAEKTRILALIDGAPPGQIGAVLRAEGIYASHVQNWRRDLASGEPKKRGPQANPLLSENKKLKLENERLEKKLAQAHQIIDLQKKVSDILGITLKAQNADENS